MSYVRLRQKQNASPWPNAYQGEPIQQPSMNQHIIGTNFHDNVELHPVPRVDSFNTSVSSHEHVSVFSTESSFHFDVPTPGDSADEIAYTPNIQDPNWQETYNETIPEQLYYALPAPQGDAEQILKNFSLPSGRPSHKNSLPSPQSTNFSTPEASGHTKNLSSTSTNFTSLLGIPHQHRHTLEMNPMESCQQDSTMHLHTHSHRLPQVTSPIIQISSHPRGDSPARSDFEQQRMSRKRSASNLSQSEYFDNVHGGTQRSMLMPPTNDAVVDWEEEEEEEGAETDRSGVAPADRDNQEHPSFDDIETHQEQEKTVNEVQDWLQRTTLSPPDRDGRGPTRPVRIRSRSTGARPHHNQQPILMSNQAPGPGVLVDEQSDYYYSSDDDDEPISQPDTHPATIPPRRDSEVAPDEVLPLANEFYRPRPWQDGVSVQPPDDNVRYQEETASLAIERFRRRAKETDSLSRAATWGTGRRRLSDGDVDSILGEGKTRHMSLTKTRIRNRGVSFVQEVKNIREQLKRSNSRSRQAQTQGHAELEKVQSPEPIDERSSTELQTYFGGSARTKAKSPSITTALRGATGSLAAVGGGSTTASGLTLNTEPQHENILQRTLRRVRSKSDVNKSPKSPAPSKPLIVHESGTASLTSATPCHNMSIVATQHLSPMTVARDSAGSTPVTMPLSPRPANVMPNLDGFKIQISELNPGLEPYLVDRIARDQVRRYKRLVQSRVDYLNSCQAGKCQSGPRCFSMGDEAEVLPTRSGSGGTASTSAQFKVSAGVDSDNDDSAFDGMVTPAAFPDGIPLPPTKKLPARFECPLCFQVKDFNKPSDWTKHVHEDVQPFTCTFASCSEPKSFKRKADWVRHENERHRHLEWWKCSLGACTHNCFRKDNFVQHLVREHKLEEPKTKGRSNPSSKGKGKANQKFTPKEQEFWNLVDSCRHEDAAEAQNEPCKFCGNILASWKKLGVHVGKHMEQIAIPVIDLAQKRNITKDTILSPIESLPSHNTSLFPAKQDVVDFSALSPFSRDGTRYQSSSAEQSPAAVFQQPYVGYRGHDGLVNPGYIPSDARAANVTSAPHSYVMHAGEPGFTTYTEYPCGEYGSFNTQHVICAHQNHVAVFIPRTTPAVGLVNIGDGYADQPQYLSGPEQQYLHYDTGETTQNHMPMRVQDQVHIPITTQEMMAPQFVYQEGWRH
ncbi:hypothetical protein LTS08_000325 [Lithohypha guttulata]|uniref:uncharacterized protein n=1 Tax=Lithohypha guttulata TaxID=1690604 RepID=UPI002DDE522C|nr:hypothetical protein LTR51_007054 [Lithohypha guttulata]KAK5106207.1 hypothetical protein LTS08_000325 [Lithohypha guttulata]